MKAILCIFLLSISAPAQDFATGFMQGMRQGEQDSLRRLQIESLQRQRASDEREYQEWVEDQNRRVQGLPPMEVETQKTPVDNERIKLKLEALKLGYELTDDGELKKIEKPRKKKP